MAACAASELVVKGRESAALLQMLLGQQPAVTGGGEMPGLRDLTEQIVRCCDRALAALQDGAEDGGARKRKLESGPAALATRSKRMRTMSAGEKVTRVEKNTMEDSFMWRKYGQKDIRDSKYPRLYFRCTYKEDHGCMARRQVQQSEADPSIYLITYFGEHTCCRDDDSEPAAPFVINFGSGTATDGQQPSGSPSWPSSCDHDASDLCSSPEEKGLRADLGDLVDELMNEQPTPVPQLKGLGSPWWEPLHGCFDWEFINSESSFDIGQFIDYNSIAGLLE